MNATSLELRRSDLCEIVDAVISSMLNSKSLPLPEGAVPGNMAAADVWSGQVKITGAFTGVVVLTCSRQFALRAAQSMFGESSPKDEDARDALAELTNVTGGNVKCLMSGITASTCHLSLPVVSTGSAASAAGRKLRELWTDCDGQKLGITVLSS